MCVILSSKETNMIVKTFNVGDANYELFFDNFEFSLVLHIDSNLKPPSSDEDYLFLDADSIDDVDLDINVFEVANESINEIIEFVKSRNIEFFFFHASTPRKCAVYRRFATRIIDGLESYSLQVAESSFYFSKN